MKIANVARQHDDVWLSVCHAGSCELCGKPYINSWLECIHFVAVGQVCSLVCTCICICMWCVYVCGMCVFVCMYNYYLQVSFIPSKVV